MPLNAGPSAHPGFRFDVSLEGPVPDVGAAAEDPASSVSHGRAHVRLWNAEAELGDEPTAFVLGPLLVLVHGCVDYRSALEFSLPPSAPTAQTVAEAFARWGPETADRLAGDFAAVVWDTGASRLWAYRTFPGPYPIYYSLPGGAPGSIVLASSIRGVLAHPKVPDTLNTVAVAEAAGGLLFGEHGETCRQAIRVLDPGWALVQRNEAGTQRIRAWKPPVDVSPGPRSEGAEQLMELLRGAVQERASAEGPTAIWLSGGFDSSAVFAAALSADPGHTSGQGRFRPVSISYPEGDPAREDEWIKSTVGRWNLSPEWIDSESIPLRTDLERSALERDEPFVHLFDTWNAALADTSRASGARVALGGDGGDQLFQAIPIHLADLARSGRPRRLFREFRALGGRTYSSFFRLAFAPLVPRLFARIYEGFRGLPFPDTMRVAPPTWLDRGFVKRHDLLERNREIVAAHIGSSRAAREVFRQASSTFFGRVAIGVRVAARSHGVLHRSPLWDRRIVEFALQRPFDERIAPGDSKVLLRAAMRGLVPDEVLAPRSQRTGAPDSVYHRFMREGVLPTVARLGKLERLADLGIVDPGAFETGVEEYRRSPSFFLGVQIAFSVDAECWLRGLA